MREFYCKRKGLFVCLFIVLSFVMLFNTTVKAEDEPVKPSESTEDKPAANVYVDILSQYMWRGFALSQASAVIQPSLTASYKGFSLNVWGNLDSNAKFQNNPSVGTKWDETDLTFSYTREIYGGLSGTVGCIYYAYALNSVFAGADVPDSFEVYGGLSYTFPWFTLAVTGYREVSHYPGWTIQFDVSRNLKLPWYDMSVDLGMTYFYLNSKDSTVYPGTFNTQGQPVDDNVAFSGMLSGQLAAALNIPLGKYFTITPKIGFAFPLSGNATNLIRYSSWDGVQNHIYGGLRISAAF
jgi:hypothetical protein